MALQYTALCLIQQNNVGDNFVVGILESDSPGTTAVAGRHVGVIPVVVVDKLVDKWDYEGFHKDDVGIFVGLASNSFQGRQVLLLQPIPLQLGEAQSSFLSLLCPLDFPLQGWASCLPPLVGQAPGWEEWAGVLLPVGTLPELCPLQPQPPHPSSPLAYSLFHLPP